MTITSLRINFDIMIILISKVVKIKKRRHFHSYEIYMQNSRYRLKVLNPRNGSEAFFNLNNWTGLTDMRCI